ncbi:hypothetical protein UN64_18425 [Fictibacillus arsenicus]|uniref:Uncharacterized protein n=1 Tax=Fictibacillus arsenicus TaxID=255247 RepID=A0A1V3G3V5_9BACL|nr:hypothetical protein UN64_18425 [Fictibacillus arsenicus]
MNAKAFSLESRFLNPKIFASNPRKTSIYPRVYIPRQITHMGRYLQGTKHKQTKNPALQKENRVLINV